MKDPAFLFYPGDWLGGTLGYTLEQKGAYLEILMLQFNRGHMTEHMIVHIIGQNWDIIKDKFTKDSNGLYYNERLEIEQSKRKAYVDSRLNNKSGKNQHTETTGHMTSHMENENEDEDLNSKLCLFKNSEFSDFEKFKSADSWFVKFPGVDLKHYFDAFMDWSNSKNKKAKDWVATVRNGIRRDNSQGKLVKIKINQVCR